MTILGLGYLLIQTFRHFAWKTRNKDVSIIKKVIYYKGRIGITLNSDMGGVALGMFYFVGYHDHPFTHTHERGHTIQNIIWGPLFLPVIGIPSIVRAALWSKIVTRAVMRGKKTPSYYDIWFERQANTFGAWLDKN